MDQDMWKAFCFDFLRERIGRMYDDVTPAEVVTWLLATWPLDKERPSRDEVLRHCLEHTVAELKSQPPTWYQIHEGLVTGKGPYECERKVTRAWGEPELRTDVVRNGLGVIEGGRTTIAGNSRAAIALR